MDPKVTVVIVNYNAGNELLSCVRSIFESDIITSIVIVDNGSNDGSLEKCREAYQKLAYIKNSHNLGFAAGANIGARYALERHAKCIIFVNPDAVLEKKCIRKLLEAVSDKSIGIAGPLTYRQQDKKIWFSGGEISYWRQRATHVTQMPSQKTPQDAVFITGCVMAVSAEVFLHVGLLDENFFLYYEDVDFSLRTQQKKLRTVVVPEAIAWHQEVSEHNKPQKTYFLVLSGLYFFKKHTRGLMRFWMHSFFLVREMRSIFRIAFSRNEIAKAVHRAFKDYRHAKKTKNLIPYR